MKPDTRIFVFFAALLVSAAIATTAVRSQDTTSPAATTLAAIDKECDAIQDAVMALKPIHVIHRSTDWNVVGDADYTVASKGNTSITIADVYKQGPNYAWVTAHRFDAKGKQTATQLCFRQSDGSLQRVRQATTVPALAAASAKEAYYSSDGKLIQKTALYAVDDPMVVKDVKSLPFYAELPQ